MFSKPPKKGDLTERVRRVAERKPPPIPTEAAPPRKKEERPGRRPLFRHATIVFDSGQTDALAGFLAAPQGFDAVVADEVMPGLTGTDLARKLRQRRADLPILLVSGYIGPIMTERALAAGVDQILKKPVQSRDLAGALARILSAETKSQQDGNTSAVA